MALPGAFPRWNEILCPVDFSEPSYTAVTAARGLSAHFSSHVTLLHVLHPLPGGRRAVSSGGERPPQLEELEREALSLLGEVADEQELVRERAALVVLHGDPADVIVRFARDQHTDLIVIATHGRTGWRRSVFGSVAERVVRLARCPVLTIRDPTEW